MFVHEDAHLITAAKTTRDAECKGSVRISINPISRKALCTESSAPLQNATFSFLGMWISQAMESRYSAAASAYGFTSNASPFCTPESGLIMIFLGLSPPPPRL